MSYQSTNIGSVITKLNIKYFLPAIQREFVWHPDQIIQLFDSILNGYPISSFLFWELKPENKDKWDIYQFVESFKQGGTHNLLAGSHGLQDVTMVLDGQQRLTSLLIGLRGSYTVKRKYMWYDNPDAWVQQRLYLDLFKDPKTQEDDLEIGVRYGFRFLDKAPAPDGVHYWFKVGQILDLDSDQACDELVDKLIESLPDSCISSISRGRRAVRGGVEGRV
jgi:uncharacterized protein with ParB-like and HNH nuclease domain